MVKNIVNTLRPPAPALRPPPPAPRGPRRVKNLRFFKVSGFGGLKNLRFFKVLGSEGLLRASWEPLRGVLEAWLQGGLLWASSRGLLGPAKISKKLMVFEGWRLKSSTVTQI